MKDILTTDTTEKQNRFYSHKIADKYFFGGYFNLASNNIYEVFEEVNKRNTFGKLAKRDNGNLKNYIIHVFKDELSISDFEKRVAIFASYFPILETVDKKSIKERNRTIDLTLSQRIRQFREMLISLVTAVDQLRNFYTHYHHSDIVIENKVLDFLNSSFVSTALHVKDKYLKTDKTKEFLKETIAAELDILIEAYKKKQIEKKNTRFKANKREDILNAIYNEAFWSFINDKDKDKDKETVVAKGADAYFEKNHHKSNDPDFALNISEKGIVYLLSFFLTNKEMDSLKANLTGFKGKVDRESGNSIKYMATQRIYSFHTYRGLKQKIRTSEEGVKETLLMQMIDELSKVPNVVYQHLSTTQQNSFIEDWNEYYKDYEDDVETDDLSRVIHPVIRKRYEDRFNYFAIRFLDEFFDFPTLRFQVHLGDYVHDRRTKQLGKVESDRIIKEKVTVFARLKDINSAKASYFHSLEEQDKEELDNKWTLFPNPSYDFPKEHTLQHQGEQKNAGKIGIYVKLRDTQYKEKAALEEARKSLNPKERSATKASKYDIITQIIEANDNVKSEKPLVFTGQPIAYLSMNDIHSMLFSLLTDNAELKKTPEEVEAKLIDQIGKQINEILSKDTDTKILKKYKDNDLKETDTDKITRDLARDKEEIEKLILEQKQRADDYNYTSSTKFNIDKSRKRKHLLFNAEKGKIGVWLANDIKRFMFKESKSKWKGYQHTELQKLFAYFDTSKSDLELILSNMVMVKDYPIELIDLVKKSRTLVDFLNKYLEARLEYIENVITRVKNSIGTPQFKTVRKECFTFLKKSNYTVVSLDKQVERILSMPLFIERGFMDDKPTMLEGKSYKQHKEKFADWFVHYKENSNYQNFYDTEVYEITTEDKREKAKVTKKIKQQQKNDVFTLMMVNYMLEEVLKLSSNDRLSLNELYQTKEERIVNKQVAKDTQERNKNYIWNKVVDLQLCDGLVHIDNVKLKDIGNFRKYENDSRVKEFLTYQSDIVWSAYLSNEVDSNKLYVIERQLDNYESIRSKELLKEVQEIECSVYNQVANKESLKQSGNENFKQYVLQGLLPIGMDVREILILSTDVKFKKEEIIQLGQAGEVEQDLYSLIYIRNKFAHNQLPIKEFFDFCENNYRSISDNEYYAEYYMEIFRSIKEKYAN
ncbi:type VI-B CRISPR-associated RNA-guided ribonuclease Cas13b [Myroides odoratimimus]|uniref:type VI-B CRISPR-associated RNA-guided ribonuclease Cas13b n=1 Tax=Myroides odoratimimus TaxID=76832 RepID=UPI002DB7CF41|nr:type VI-B CRISPR-associated RNA-guided ribonuclease Cas13b [Myroides odoratimimus]MEC4043729.1 type VI-B CRISPR-associated RNA-guided ribonuclease Cas13b [Myroides odoratimimus]MEC4151566.1 type VI-B CRISPR-associated RNA-guided ribonuclease Cas13b [Myroides odoratimimus]